MKLFLRSTLLALSLADPVFADDPIVLKFSNKYFHIKEPGAEQRIRVKIPEEHRVGEIEFLHFSFCPTEAGPLNFPAIEISLGDRKFVIPEAHYHVFPPAREEANFDVQHASHPERPHIVVLRVYERTPDRQVFLNAMPLPRGVTIEHHSFLGVSTGGRIGTVYLRNQSAKPFILSRDSFTNVPADMDFPVITIPPGKKK